MVKLGDVVPADMRVVTAANIECDEALRLTGEADHKPPPEGTGGPDPDCVRSDGDVGVGDCINMSFSSAGRATGIVIAAGMGTQVGAITTAISGEKSRVRKVDGDGQKLGLGVRDQGGDYALAGFSIGSAAPNQAFEACIHSIYREPPYNVSWQNTHAYTLQCAVILALIVFGVARFHVTNEVAIYAIAYAPSPLSAAPTKTLACSLSIAVTPESLIAILTITMSAGTSRMAKQQGIIRKLNALGALGGATDVCSGKTGTLI
ncbi:Na+ ATPase [Ceratobasidium sp. 414]|nr:Na+ ATPase [Ceratobasidium sp. 414]